MPTNEQILTIILGTPRYYQLLYAFAKGQFNHENLDFLAAAQAYRKDPGKKKAIAIIDKYVKDDGQSKFSYGDAGLLNIDGPSTAYLIGKKAEYVRDRETAHTMGFFKRHWTAGDRKAVEGLFDEAVITVRQQVVHNVLVPFLANETGRLIGAQIQQSQARAAHTRQALIDTGLA